jgi:alkylation response protein AidB-like acyl-CoA dehydrogenase
MSEVETGAFDEVRHEVMRVLRAECTPERHEALLDQPGGFDHKLWQLAAEQGWTGAALSEDRGGLGLGWKGLAVIVESLGQHLAGLPLAANALAAHAVLDSEQADLIERHAQALVDGRQCACLALGSLVQGALGAASGLQLDAEQKLSGHVAGVAFGAVADLALVAAEGSDGQAAWLLVALAQPAVRREIGEALDNARAYADLSFEGASVQVLCTGEAARSTQRRTLAHAALLQAFEQLGGAVQCLALTREYALQREAFGQPIARFQAIKHKLVEIYGLIEIARGCALAALELIDATPNLRDEAVAAARLSASRAYEIAARDGILIHGAIGVTREAAPHRHYRRARALALELGAAALWRNDLVDQLVARVQTAQEETGA